MKKMWLLFILLFILIPFVSAQDEDAGGISRLANVFEPVNDLLVGVMSIFS